uniref:Uncharacterized protein n=1 Tax=Rhizophora mucronata TaxID=61149 RepID=A0A2P2PLV8_RHIMU
MWDIHKDGVRPSFTEALAMTYLVISRWACELPG